MSRSASTYWRSKQSLGQFDGFGFFAVLQQSARLIARRLELREELFFQFDHPGQIAVLRTERLLMGVCHFPQITSEKLRTF